MGYPCPWCNTVFDREAAWLAHQRSNRACAIAHAAVNGPQGRGGRRHTVGADPNNDWPPEDDPPDDPGDDPMEEDGGGAGGEQDEEEAAQHNEDSEEEVEDEESPEDRVDRMIVTALLSAGAGKDALTDGGKKKILDLIHDPAFDVSVTSIRTIADVQRYLEKVWVESDRGWLQEVYIAPQQCDPEHWKSELSIYVADGLASAMDMVQSKEAVKHLMWEWRGPEGEYSGPLSGTRALARRQMVKNAFGEHVIYVPLAWFSDKTHLDVKGRHHCHPGFLKLAGWDDKMQYDRRGSRIVVLLPSLPNVPYHGAEGTPGSAFKSKTAWGNYLKMRRFDIHQQAIAIALGPLQEASHRYIIIHAKTYLLPCTTSTVQMVHYMHVKVQCSIAVFNCYCGMHESTYGYVQLLC
jgi:hypothetical protein